MPEEEYTEITQEQIDAEVASSEYDLRKADVMLKFEADPDFVWLFQEVFINAFAITNTMNMANSDPQVRARIHEKMIARGHFSDFCHMIKEDGKTARENLAAYRTMMAEADGDNSEETSS